VVPNSVLGVVVFLLFVVPGTCYELLRGRTRLPREESAFQQISRVLLFGSVITAAVLLALAFIGWAAPGSLLNLSAFMTDGARYAAGNIGRVGWTIVIFLLLSLLYAVVINDVRTSGGATLIRQADSWHTVARQIPEEYLEGEQLVTASVRLKSGRDVVGTFAGASTELDPSKRELTLQSPLKAREPGEKDAVLLDGDWAFMVVVGAEIESVTFAYTPSGEDSPADDRSVRSGRIRSAGLWLLEHVFDWRLAASAALFVMLLAVVVGNLI
jgi:hypothetical protein